MPKETKHDIGERMKPLAGGIEIHNPDGTLFYPSDNPNASEQEKEDRKWYDLRQANLKKQEPS